jgi:hypothetical protein
MTRHGFEVAGLDGAHISLSSAQLEELSSRTRAPLLRAGDTGWEDAIRIWNGMVARAPALAIQPASAVDVVEAVTFARDHGLLVSIKGGGHNIAGTAVADWGVDARHVAHAGAGDRGAGCQARARGCGMPAATRGWRDTGSTGSQRCSDSCPKPASPA